MSAEMAKPARQPLENPNFAMGINSIFSPFFNNIFRISSTIRLVFKAPPCKTTATSFWGKSITLLMPAIAWALIPEFLKIGVFNLA